MMGCSLGMPPRQKVAYKLPGTKGGVLGPERFPRPQCRRGIPFWSLSLIQHKLTKAPFESLKEASLKYLTFKKVFHEALGSGEK